MTEKKSGRISRGVKGPISLVVPAVRMVVVRVVAWEGDNGEITVGEDIMPVLAIGTWVERKYAMRVADKEQAKGTEILGHTDKQITEEGWEPQGTEHLTDILYFDAEYEEPVWLRADRDPWAGPSVERSVCCNWPQTEDEERLRPLVDKLKEEMERTAKIAKIEHDHESHLRSGEESIETEEVPC